MIAVLQPYSQLMRLHQPVGIWLLLWPCWWGYALATAGNPQPATLALLALGAVLMRGAGCIVNDIADRKLDAQVERTRTRPLASGALSVKQALALLSLLLAASLGVAWALGFAVVLWGALALLPVALYPLMKRISWWPQLFLGLTFSWGVWIGFAAAGVTPTLSAALLYAACVCWTLGYDTIYAYQDASDDARIGIRSSARALGASGKKGVAFFYSLMLTLLALCGLYAGLKAPFWVALALTAIHLFWQVWRVELNAPPSCKRIFISNAALGWLVFAGIIAV